MNDQSSRSHAVISIYIENKIKQYEEATEKVQELTNAINRRNSMANQWNDEYMNRFYELENYWNYLQTGKASKTFAIINLGTCRRIFS